jgi:hypothetical protein
MTLDTFMAALGHVQHYCRRGTQTEVSLTGIGEAILHPAFIGMLRILRSVLGTREIVLATNGVALDSVIAEALSQSQVHVYVSLHRPEVAGPAIELLRKHRCRFEVNHAFVDRSIDWAGQVDWPASGPRHVCDYLRKGWAVVRQCGSIDACCMDAHDLYPIGHVGDDYGSLITRATNLCASCHLIVPDELREAS